MMTQKVHVHIYVLTYAMQMVVVRNLRPNVVFDFALQNYGNSTSYFAFLAYNSAEWTN